MKYYLLDGEQKQYIAISEKSVFMYVVGLPLIYLDPETDSRAAFVQMGTPLIGKEVSSYEFERLMLDMHFPEETSFAKALVRYKLEANGSPTVLVTSDNSTFSLN